MGGGGQADTKTTTVQLSPEQRQMLDLSMPFLKNFAANPPEMQGADKTVAPFTAPQVQGQADVLAAAPTAGNIVGSAGNASRFLTSGAALDPSTNTFLDSTIRAAQRPIFERLTEDVLPNIRSSAAMNGMGGVGANYGGSRQGIAEGIASRGALNAAGDVGTNIAEKGYLSGLDAMTKGLALAPTTATSQAIPGSIESTVGDVQQNQGQRVADANNAQFNFQQWLPYIMGSSLAGLSGAIPGGSTTATGTATTSPSPLQIATGVGSIGAGLLGSGGISSLLPLMAMSDLRLKDILGRVGEKNGFPLYRFRFKGQTKEYIGVIAQEVQETRPDAIREMPGGYLAVDYGALGLRMEEANGD